MHFHFFFTVNAVMIVLNLWLFLLISLQNCKVTVKQHAYNWLTLHVLSNFPSRLNVLIFHLLEMFESSKFIVLSISESHLAMSSSLGPHTLFSPWNSAGKSKGVGILSFLQVILPTQDSKPGLLHSRQILYQLCHKGSPRIPEWIAYPLQQTFPTQEVNRCLLHCRKILHQLSYQRL